MTAGKSSAGQRGAALFRRITQATSPAVVILSEPLPLQTATDLERRLVETGWHVAVIDATTAQNAKSFLIEALSAGFRFPAYSGRNWDALLDSLYDLSWIEADGYCCVLLGTENLRRIDPEALAVFRGIFEGAAKAWKARGTSFSLLLG